MAYCRVRRFALLVLLALVAAMGCSRADVADPPPPVDITLQRSTLYVDGSPFFLFGGYWIQPKGTTNDDRVAAVDTADELGWNVLHTEAYFAVQTDPMVAEAQAKGVHLGLQSAFDGTHDDMVSRYAENPAVLYWQVADDANAEYTQAEVHARYDRIEKRDPNHPKWVGHYGRTAATIEKYVDEAQLSGYYTYPLPDSPIARVYRMQKVHVQAARRVGTVPVAVIQAFSDPQHGPAPSAAEVRNMTFQAVVAGAQGIMYYTLADPRFDMDRDAPDVFDAMPRWSEQILGLRDLLTTGVRRYLDTGTGNVVATRWTLDGRDVVIVVNTSREPRRYHIAGIASAEDLGDSDGRFDADGTLRGRLPPLGVQRLQVEVGG